MAIERAVLEDAPEITEVVVDGVAAEPELLQIHPYQGLRGPRTSRHVNGPGRKENT